MLNYNFKDKSLLIRALTHRSLGRDNNERLEYLGDAVVGFVIAEALYQKLPNASEGELTRLRAFLVKGERLAEIAIQHKIQDALRLGPGELKSGGWCRKSVLANALEALLGAIYIDSGFAACRQVILDLYQPYLDTVNLSDIKKDAKTMLQEFLQSRQLNIPVYTVTNQSGSSHNPNFQVRCKVDVLEGDVIAEGQSKRKAEQAAAEKVLAILLPNI